MTLIPYPELPSGTGSTNDGFLERVAGGAREALCGVYNSSPGQLFRNVGLNSPGGRIARGILDDACSLPGGGSSGGGGAGRSWDELPPVPPGGQCDGVFYQVTIEFEEWESDSNTASCKKRKSTFSNVFVWGAVTGIRVDSPGTYSQAWCQNQQGFREIELNCLGGASQPFVRGWYVVRAGSEPNVISARIVSITRVDGQADSCGLLPYPEEDDPGDVIINLPDINIDIRPNVNINLPITIAPITNIVLAPTVFAPIIPVNVGGIQLNFGVGGVEVSPDSRRPSDRPSQPVPQPLVDTINNINNTVNNINTVINNIDIDLAPVLEAIENLETLTRRGFDRIEDLLECLDSIIRASSCCEVIERTEGSQVLTTFIANPPNDVIFLSMGDDRRAFILIEVLEPVPTGVRVFNLNQSDRDYEAGFGNVALGIEAENEPGWVQAGIHHIFQKYTLIEIPQHEVPYSIRVSLKGGVIINVIDPGYRWVKKELPECFEIVEM